MRTPSTFFVYRIGVFNGELRARCIVCDSIIYGEDWATDSMIQGIVLETGAFVELRRSMSETFDEELGPPSVYEQETCLQGLDRRDSIAISVAQNFDYIRISQKLSDISVPFFISTASPTFSEHRHLKLLFAFSDIYLLPDVQEYDRNANVLDRWDAMLLSKQSRSALPLPVGIWFPASFNDGVKLAPGVYSIKKWTSDNEAIVEIFCSDRSVNLDSGCKIQRIVKPQDGRTLCVDVATVTGDLRHN